MEKEQNGQQNVIVKISDIMMKVKSKEDMINVMREKSKQ